LEKSKQKSKKTPLEVALRFLRHRARSEKEIRVYLARHFESAEIDQVVKRLHDWKFIDDEEFAKTYVEFRSPSKPRSRRLLKLELAKKGIKIEDNLENLESEEVLAEKALNKKKTLKSFGQAVRFLQSRGFSWKVIEKTIKKRYNS